RPARRPAASAKHVGSEACGSPGGSDQPTSLLVGWAKAPSSFWRATANREGESSDEPRGRRTRGSDGASPSPMAARRAGGGSLRGLLSLLEGLARAPR